MAEPRPDLHTAAPAIPAGRELVTVLLGRLGEHSYEGGVNGTCYECPFATVPLEANGREARREDVSNDPTEAYFRCYLPERPGAAVETEWGEYAPCEEKDWVRALRTALAPYLDGSATATSLSGGES